MMDQVCFRWNVFVLPLVAAALVVVYYRLIDPSLGADQTTIAGQIQSIQAELETLKSSFQKSFEGTNGRLEALERKQHISSTGMEKIQKSMEERLQTIAKADDKVAKTEIDNTDNNIGDNIVWFAVCFNTVAVLAMFTALGVILKRKRTDTDRHTDAKVEINKS